MTFDAELDQLFQETFQEPLSNKPQPISLPDPPKPAQSTGTNRKEQAPRTVFIGNVHIEVLKSKEKQTEFKQFLSSFGKIESLRFRSIPVERAPSRKIAISKKQFRTDLDSCNCYVVFEQEDSVQKATQENGRIFLDKHLRIDQVTEQKPVASGKKSIFVGNLPFNVQEEEIWKLFETCGVIESVRIVRDAATNIGKGIAFVNFSERTAVNLALKLNESTFRDRSIRITRYESEKELAKNKNNSIAKGKGKGKKQPSKKSFKKEPKTKDKGKHSALADGRKKKEKKSKSDKKTL